MFYHTVAEDTEETAVELALDRLRFPEELSEKNKKCLQNIHTGSIWKTVAAYLVKREDIEGIRFPGAEEAVGVNQSFTERVWDVSGRGEQDGKY